MLELREPKKPPYRDGKRVLECLQKSLRIASSCIDDLTSVQLYVDALDRYIYYFEQGVEAVTAKYINSLVDLITNNIDSITMLAASGAGPGGEDYSVGGDIRGGPGGRGGRGGQGAPGLVDGVNTPDMIVKASLQASLLFLSFARPAY